MTVQIIRGNALALPLEDNSVDLICTSPPYFGLRSYTDGCSTCSGSGRATNRGYMERYCPACGRVFESGRNKCHKCDRTTLRTERTKADAKPDAQCPDCQGTGRGHYSGQLGSEATPAEFVDALIAATREMVRCLKPSGSIFVNLGDKYASYEGNRGRGSLQDNGPRPITPGGSGLSGGGFVKAKSLMGLPWRYALACIDQLGLILRAEIIWAKPNGLPESVTDRVRRSHEQWFHMTLEPRYYSAVDEIRETYAPGTAARYAAGYQQTHAVTAGQTANGVLRVDNGGPGTTNPLGKLPGSVWTVPTQPLTVPASLGVDHFAAFPMEWPRRIIRGWSPSGICTVCGEGRRPVTGHAPWWAEYKERNGLGDYLAGNGLEPSVAGKQRAGSVPIPPGPKTQITGESCGCETPTAPTRPAVVLDPFGGTGTTALVAHALGRHGISVDMSADYCRLAEWRCNDPGQLAAALQVEKPEPVPEDQLSLFGDLEREPARPSGGLAYSEARGNRTCASCGHRTQYAKDVCDRCGADRVLFGEEAS